MMLVFKLILSDVDLTLFSWHVHIPLPVGVLLLISFLVGALLFYLIAVYSARSDRRELQKLRKRVQELELTVQSVRAPSGPLAGGPPIVPMPGMPGTRPGPYS